MFRFIILSAFVVLTLGGVTQRRQPVPILDGRIVGGRDATIEEFPYQVSLQRNGKHLCGASLIAPNIALTAGHCTEKFTASSLTVRAGVTLRNEGGEVAQVVSICEHSSYDGETLDYDVSVLHLDRSFKLSAKIQTVSLQGTGVEVSVGKLVAVTGWGALYSEGLFPRNLQAVEVPQVSHQNCTTAYSPKYEITDRMTCLGYEQGGKDACQGDSGGPAVVDGKQVGIVSWGVGCASPDIPGVYSKISNEEIQGHINSCVAKFRAPLNLH